MNFSNTTTYPQTQVTRTVYALQASIGQVYPGFSQKDYTLRNRVSYMQFFDQFGNGGAVDYYEAEVISAQDYYPFGMLQPGRSFNAGGYRYGFNGQERSTELNDNSYTAEFWEYDSRLGRRWNVDPVVKIWQSPYLTFRNNPLFYVDPDGNDDIFDRNGKFLGRTASGNNIRVVNSSSIKFSTASKNLDAYTKLITDFSYFPKEMANRSILIGVMTHYANQVGIKKVLKIWDNNEKSAAFAFALKDAPTINVKKGDYVVSVTNGNANSDDANYNNVLNNLWHEKKHKERQDSYENLGHARVEMDQIKDPSFDNTTDEHKDGFTSYIRKQLNQKLENDPNSVDKVKAFIDEYNSNEKVKKYIMANLYYDEQGKLLVL